MEIFITIVGFILAIWGVVWAIREGMDERIFRRAPKTKTKRRKDEDEHGENSMQLGYRPDTHVDFDWDFDSDSTEASPKRSSAPKPQQSRTQPPAENEKRSTAKPPIVNRTSPARTSEPQPTMSVIKVPKLQTNASFFTPEQAQKYKEKSSSMRLGRALTQGMLLEHLKTDKTTTPYTASATVHSLKSGMQYKTTLTSCSCPDHQKRKEPCKHMLALAIYVGAIKLDEN